jgi:hypothetical protein
LFVLKMLRKYLKQGIPLGYLELTFEELMVSSLREFR